MNPTEPIPQDPPPRRKMTPLGIFLLCSPLAMDGKTVSTTRFDPDMHHGRVVMLRIDNAATSHPINPKSGELLINGKPWLTTGSDTVWGTEITPHVATPEPKQRTVSQ